MIEDIRADAAIGNAVRERIDAAIMGRDYIDPITPAADGAVPAAAQSPNTPAVQTSFSGQAYYEPNPDSWGTSTQAIEGKKALEEMMGTLPKPTRRSRPRKPKDGEQP